MIEDNMDGQLLFDIMMNYIRHNKIVNFSQFQHNLTKHSFKTQLEFYQLYLPYILSMTVADPSMYNKVYDMLEEVMSYATKILYDRPVDIANIDYYACLEAYELLYTNNMEQSLIDRHIDILNKYVKIAMYNNSVEITNNGIYIHTNHLQDHEKPKILILLFMYNIINFFNIIPDGYRVYVL